MDQKDLDFEQDLIDSELLLKNTARSMDDDAEYTLESILAEYLSLIHICILDVAKDKELNASMPDDSKRIPFTNMIYIGDGLSDVPCMKMKMCIRDRFLDNLNRALSTMLLGLLVFYGANELIFRVCNVLFNSRTNLNDMTCLLYTSRCV